MLRQWQRPALGAQVALAASLLASMLFGPHGVGTLASEDDCACAASAPLDVTEGGGLDAAWGEGEVVAPLGGGGRDACPPGCDCPCCGSPIASAESSRASLAPVGSVALAAARDGSRDAPVGERDGVFRPPRG